MMQLLRENPLLLLFVTASIGFFLGNIKVRGSSLGVAAVLFTGLALGALDPDFTIPDIIFFLGLSMFVYSIGLSSGPAFFNSYKRNGIRDIIFILVMLLFTGLIAGLLFLLFDFSAATITGMYTGSTTNTAALAGVLDYISNTASSDASGIMEEAVIGYTWTYPIGVFGGIIAIVLMEKLLKIDYKAEERSLRKLYPIEGDLTSMTVRVENENLGQVQLRDLFNKYNWNVVFGRFNKQGNVKLANWDLIPELGDEIMVVGNKDELDDVVSILGSQIKSSLKYNRREFDVRRIFVSNSKLAGRTIASLNLDQKFNAVITRIKRGDVDMLATGHTVLELGDRIRFIARRKDLKALSTYFGDSYHASSKVNLFTFGLGIGLGLILGSFEIPLGADVSFKLGYAGGPLVVGLVLGALRRTGPIVWTMPYGAMITLQQIGLIFLLSAIGVKSGNAFIESFSINGLYIFLGGVVISLLTAVFLLFIGYKMLKMPFSFLMGIVSNQPAILDFATSRSKNRIPEFGFSMMFPIALIVKIIIAQVLYIILSS
jgi:putative transport protein